METTTGQGRRDLDRDRVGLVSDHVFHDAVLAHLRKTKPLERSIQNHAAGLSGEDQAMVDQYTIRTETELNLPVVRPPPGSDVYLAGRLWQWWPLLELEKGQTYRLHISSMDWQHGFSLQPVNINTQILPGYEMVLTLRQIHRANRPLSVTSSAGSVTTTWWARFT